MPNIDLTPAIGSDARTRAAETLVEEFSALMRVVHLHKAQTATRSAHTLLFPLLHHGGLRTTALAELMHTDPSTTSRQVAELVTEGLVSREPDPADRRASVVQVTQAGCAAVAALRAERAALFADAMAGWSLTDLDAFTTDLRRFRESLAAAALPAVCSSEQPAPPTPREP